jgi:hypothetical protein
MDRAQVLHIYRLDLINSQQRQQQRQKTYYEAVALLSLA